MRTYLILLSLSVAGLLLLLINNALPQGHWISMWLSQLSSVLLIGGVIGIIDKKILHRDHFAQTQQLFSIKESIVKNGLTKIHRNSANYDYSELFNSERLTIVLNDGRTWISSKIPELQQRFQKPNSHTKLFVVDPQGDFAPTLARKTGYTVEEQADKIHQAKKRIVEEYIIAKCQGILQVFYIPYFPTHTIFLGDSHVAITLYNISSGRGAVPLLEFTSDPQRKAVFEDIVEDLADLERESTCVFDSTSEKTQHD